MALSRAAHISHGKIMAGWIVVILVLGIAAYAVSMYNSLVSNRQLSQEGWSGIELQLARRYYNGTARNLNPAIQQFPSSIIAGAFHFAMVQYFEIDNAADRAVPTVKFS